MHELHAWVPSKVVTLSLSEGRPQYMCSIASVCRPNHILLAPRFHVIFSAVQIGDAVIKETAVLKLNYLEAESAAAMLEIC